MSWKDDLIDAWVDNMPDNYDSLSPEQQLKVYMKWEQEYMEGSVCRAESMEDR